MTPSRKRKREINGNIDKPIERTCFENAAFSSTPKKYTSNESASRDSNGIADQYFQDNKVQEIINPFEIIRKPQKKRKYFEDICFENPALNLDGPDRQLNPFEIFRHLPQSGAHSGYVNKALNTESQQASTEIDTFSKNFKNPSFNSRKPTDLTIALPFVPNVGCRIDFSNMALSNICPHRVLENQLPRPDLTITKQFVETSFENEESVISIGKELDRYQLELENGINEAKVKKSNYLNSNDFKVSKSLKTLEDIKEAEEIEDIEQTNCNIGDNNEIINNTDLLNVNYNADVQNIEPNSEPTFKRSYRPAEIIRLSNNKENENKTKFVNCIPETNTGTLGSRKTFDTTTLRRSIRKLIDQKSKPFEMKNPEPKESCSVKPHTNIFDSIRRSMRRKNLEAMSANKTNVSIIDASEKRMKFKSNVCSVSMEKEINKPMNGLKQSVISVFRSQKRGYDLN